MAYDELLTIENVTSAQQLGSAYEGTGKDLSQGSYRSATPHWVRIAISEGAASTSTPVVVTFTVQHSSTASTSGYTDCSTLTTSVTDTSISPRILMIPVTTELRYIRIRASKGTGTISTGLKWLAQLGNCQES